MPVSLSDLVLPRDPDDVLDSATKQYVDSVVSTSTPPAMIDTGQTPPSNPQVGQLWFPIATAPAPVAGISGPTSVPQGAGSACVSNFSSTSTGDITSYLWEFDYSIPGHVTNVNPSSSTAQSPGNVCWSTDNPTGSYTIRLTVTGPGGSDSTTHNFTTFDFAPP